MFRFRWIFLVALICLPVAFLAFDWRVPGFDAGAAVAQPLAVPDGDREMAWLHTTTSNTTWERFVAGWVRQQRTVPGLKVDASKAFLDSTTAAPELVVGMAGRAGLLRIRWYKLQSDLGVGEWIRALAARDRPPLAIIGGGSSDRAVELARALEAEHRWKGDRPALFITTATADSVAGTEAESGAQPRLVDLYDDRSFRFCFTNRQMADAVLDYVEQTPDLRPIVFEDQSLQALAPLAAGVPKPPRYRPHVFSVQWSDDPYSTDLHDQFKKSLLADAGERGGNPGAYQLFQLHVPFSVGGFVRPNIHEEETAKFIARELQTIPSQRSLLVLPTATAPARRLLRAIVERTRQFSRRMVVVTGDGIPVNAILRDGEYAWPAGALPVPLVLFTHNNPIGWDEPTPEADPTFLPPNSTEEAMHFGEMGRIVIAACFPAAGEAPGMTIEGGLLTRSDDLIRRLRSARPAFFDADGERLGGTGEYVVVLMPRDTASQIQEGAQLSVWRREPDRTWRGVGQVPVVARPSAAGATPP